MKVIIGAAIVGILIFVPAWSVSYWQGWLLMAVLFIPMFIAGIIMMIKNPDLLRKRLNADEEQDEQKAVVFLIGYVLYAEVLKENTYLSRTVEVQENQKVVDTGLYGIVRHPMYMATLLLFLSMPLVLGSIISFAVMLLYIPIINKRMNNEEKVLSEGLPGYKEYMNKVRSRVIPHIW